MKLGLKARQTGLRLKKVVVLGIAGLIWEAMTAGPAATAETTREEDRIVHERVINRAKVENLQRWVSAGHADWCRDARMVAAEELWRLAPDYSGSGFELNAVIADANANGGNRVMFEWVPLDGRTIYRVTLERFDWLLPIAGNTESIVWVPTSMEIRVHE